MNLLIAISHHGLEEVRLLVEIPCSNIIVFKIVRLSYLIMPYFL